MSDEKDEIITKECPRCGKKIQSLSEKQAEYNYALHVTSCTNIPLNKNKGGKK